MGGRGAKYKSKSNKTARQTSSILAPVIAKTMKEAIGTKGAPFRIGNSIKNSNPNYDKKEINTEYNENCQRCIVAYELRRRGYDVTALPTYSGDTLNAIVYKGKKRDWDAWLKAFRKAKPISVGGINESAVKSRIVENMENFGSGARAVLSFSYKHGGGHVINIENVNGNIIAIDAQNGAVTNIIDELKGTKTRRVTLVRTDNLRLDNDVRLFVTSENLYKRRR